MIGRRGFLRAFLGGAAAIPFGGKLRRLFRRPTLEGIPIRFQEPLDDEQYFIGNFVQRAQIKPPDPVPARVRFPEVGVEWRTLRYRVPELPPPTQHDVWLFKLGLGPCDCVECRGLERLCVELS